MISANQEIIGFEKLIIKMFKQEGFSIKHNKNKNFGNYKRQTVTGIVVNKKISIPIEKRELLKAVLNNCVVDGPSSQINKYWETFGETKSREKSKIKFQERLLGMIKRVSTLNKSYGQRLKRRYNQIDWNK